MNPNLNNEVADKLAKANINLALKWCELLHNENMQLLQSFQKGCVNCHQELENNAKKALGSNDWVSMNMSWMTLPMTLMKMQSWQTQQLFEFNAKVQQQANAMLRDAVSGWQKEVAAAMQEGAGAMPLSSALRNWFNGSMMMHPGNSEMTSAQTPATQKKFAEPSRVVSS